MSEHETANQRSTLEQGNSQAIYAFLGISARYLGLTDSSDWPPVGTFQMDAGARRVEGEASI